MNNHPHIGKNIRAARELRNYTQDFIAKSIGVSTSRYSKIEQEAEINTTNLYKIAELLDIDVFKLLSFDGQKYFDIDKNNKANNFSNNTIEYLHEIADAVKELGVTLKTILSNKNIP